MNRINNKSISALLWLTLCSSAIAAEFTPDDVVSYKKIGEVELKLHVFKHEGHQVSDKRPAIVFFFGGGWVGGTPRQFYQQSRFLADHGMVAFAAEYRVRNAHKTSPYECVKDGKSAIRWLRQHAAKLGVDPGRIVSAGGSAGGHVAACTGVIEGFEEEGEDISVSSVPNAMVLFNPVLDTTAKGFGAGHFQPEKKTELSPCHHVRKGLVPTIVFQGTADTTTPPENAERFARLMKEAGNDCEVVSYEGRKHGFFNGTFFRAKNDGKDNADTMQKTVDFLRAHGLQPSASSVRPNIVVMLADDMGYGELQCLNPKRGKIKTPQLDSIAAQGMIFTDAHTGSSVCTPTRYGLMTGRYSWRTHMQRGVLSGGESLIARERMTIAEMLKKQGYHTAMFGKWHLGMLFDGKENPSNKLPLGTAVSDGPIEAGGFDEFAGFHHARQMGIWVENQKVVEHIEPIEMLPKLTAAAVEFIKRRKDNPQPFFLYVPWNSPHSPVVPSPEWQGKSGLNAHGDFVMQTDESYGQIVKALKENGMLENTLIICSSDNGTSGPASKKGQLEKMGHFPSGDLRGAKASLWDGGHRVPFLVHWPAVIKPGSRNDQLVCMTDVMATCADVLGVSLPTNAAEDSVSFLPALKGEPIVSTRAGVIHHSVSGHFSYRLGKWKLLLAKGSGAWDAPTEKEPKEGGPKGQLYDMENDLSERNNLYETHPEIVERLLAQLESDVKNGRSIAGPASSNDIDEIILWKSGSRKDR